MKEIPLTQGQFATVDDHWYEYLMQWKWHARWDKTTNSYYAMRTENSRKILMHRVIMKTPDGMVCDHIFHNTLDNREGEMRNVTPSQSMMNRRMQKNNKTGVIGVTQRKNSKKFRVTLAIEGKMVFDRSYKTIEEATQRRKEVVDKYFSQFANTQNDVS